MKNKILFFLIPILGLMVIVLGSFALYKTSKLSESTYNYENSIKILKDAIFFEKEHFFTEVRFWQYIYDPNQETKNDFENSNNDFKDSLNTLEGTITVNSSLLYKNGNDDFALIKDQLNKIETEISSLVNSLEKYQEAQKNGASAESLASIEKEIRKTVLEDKNKFEDLKFDDNLNSMVSSQIENSDYYKNQSLNFQRQVIIIVDILSGVYMVSLFLIVILLGRIIGKFKKFTR